MEKHLALPVPIYGYHICFCDEKQLQDDEYSFSSHPDKYTLPSKLISVRKSPIQTAVDSFSIVTDWYDMSGQKARYCANSPFASAGSDFSWALDIQGVMTLLWYPLEQTIYYTKNEGYSQERLRFWVYHTFFPMVLELMRRYTILHVGAVEVEGIPILFSAPSFGGKSTMVDYFVKSGHTLYSDDALAIERSEGEYLAVASYPYHRPYRKPEELGYRVEAYGAVPKNIGALYLLDKKTANDEIKIIELKGIEKYKAFHHSIFIEFSFRKQERFRFFSEMARNIPVFKISYPHDIERLANVYCKIVTHVKERKV